MAPLARCRALRHETENELCVMWFLFHDHVSRARGPVADAVPVVRSRTGARGFYYKKSPRNFELDFFILVSLSRYMSGVEPTNPAQYRINPIPTALMPQHTAPELISA